MGWEWGTQPALEPSCFCPPVCGTLSLLHLKSCLEVGGKKFLPPPSTSMAALWDHSGPHWDEWQGWKVMRLSMGWILTSGEISRSPSLPVDENGVASTARLIQSDKDLLILNHINIDSPNLSLSGEQMLPQGQIKG